MTIDYVGFAYAATVAAGGIMGYAKAGNYRVFFYRIRAVSRRINFCNDELPFVCFTGSLPSLGAGLVFGAVLGCGAYLITQDSTNIYLSLGTSALLGGIMGVRYYNSQKFMPAGLIAVLR